MFLINTVFKYHIKRIKNRIISLIYHKRNKVLVKRISVNYEKKVIFIIVNKYFVFWEGKNNITLHFI